MEKLYATLDNDTAVYNRLGNIKSFIFWSYKEVYEGYRMRKLSNGLIVFLLKQCVKKYGDLESSYWEVNDSVYEELFKQYQNQQRNNWVKYVRDCEEDEIKPIDYYAWLEKKLMENQNEY